MAQAFAEIGDGGNDRMSIKNILNEDSPSNQATSEASDFSSRSYAEITLHQMLEDAIKYSQILREPPDPRADFEIRQMPRQAETHHQNNSSPESSLPRRMTHVKSREHPIQGSCWHIPAGSCHGIPLKCNIPTDIANIGLIPCHKPHNPELTKNTLTCMEPCITYVKFNCAERCRTKGVCVHYQFVCGCRRVPDGMTCTTCEGARVEMALQQRRKCPYHQTFHEEGESSSRPEDFLASDKQKNRCEEILRRSIEADWEGVPGPQWSLQDIIAESVKVMNFTGV